MTARWGTAMCAGTLAAAVAACETPKRVAACAPAQGVELWVERRFPPSAQLADTAFASLSVAVARDSAAQLPVGSMISVVVAGPSSAPVPDTIRVMTAEQPAGGALWRGDELRPGAYTAQLTTNGFAAGPRAFTLAPGERAEVEVRLHETGDCDTTRATRR